MYSTKLMLHFVWLCAFAICFADSDTNVDGNFGMRIGKRTKITNLLSISPITIRKVPVVSNEYLTLDDNENVAFPLRMSKERKLPSTSGTKLSVQQNIADGSTVIEPITTSTKRPRRTRRPRPTLTSSITVRDESSTTTTTKRPRRTLRPKPTTPEIIVQSVSDYIADAMNDDALDMLTEQTSTASIQNEFVSTMTTKRPRRTTKNPFGQSGILESSSAIESIIMMDELNKSNDTSAIETSSSTLSFLEFQNNVIESITTKRPRPTRRTRPTLSNLASITMRDESSMTTTTKRPRRTIRPKPTTLVITTRPASEYASSDGIIEEATDALTEQLSSTSTTVFFSTVKIRNQSFPTTTTNRPRQKDTTTATNTILETSAETESLDELTKGNNTSVPTETAISIETPSSLLSLLEFQSNIIQNITTKRPRSTRQPRPIKLSKTASEASNYDDDYESTTDAGID